ncbi:CPP1-like family protein [Leptolyngbya sp. AN02str]|uniref:CPP1-like family protein n=1 Tax=Leptolyngbya sp. AN02str TaxID=3423363 RepID=UPI003D31095F
MSDLSHYEKLGVDEDSSFEEIQEARDRLLETCKGDRRQAEAIETAYDAILMERLRMRQEGRIKVPDRIRFPERIVEPAPDYAPTPAKASPEWLQRLVDTPSRNDVLLPGGLMLAAALFSLSSPPVALALGVSFCFYFLNRKEHKFGRAFLLTLIALVVGVLMGLGIGSVLATMLGGMGLSPDAFAAMLTMVLLWVVSSFLR